MGCGKSKHAVDAASAPTALARKKSAIKKSSSTTDASMNSARREDETTPPLPPPRDQNLSIDNNGNAAMAEEVKQEAEPGRLISRESPNRFFSSHKDVEMVAAAIRDVKSDDGDSEYGSPRTESTGRDDSSSEWNVHDTAEKEGEKASEVAAVAVVEAAGEAPAAVVVVESEAPETKPQQQQNDGDRKEEVGKSEGSSAAEESIVKSM